MQIIRVLSVFATFLLAPLVSVAQEQTTQKTSSVTEHIQLLETMIYMWPEREYYLQLANLYGRVNEDGRRLELYEIAYAMGWLTKRTDLVQLAQLLLRADRLDEADRVAQKALAMGPAEPADSD